MEKTTPKKEEKKLTPPAPTETKETTVSIPEIIEAPVVPQNFKSKLSRQQVEIIKTQIAKGASDDELKMFLFVCERTGLDPFTKQVHLVPRWDGKLGQEVRSVIVGIDGLRAVAEKTGTYAGNTDPIMGEETEITYEEASYSNGRKTGAVTKKLNVPTKATVTVKKIVQGVICDFTATAKWSEYYPGDKQGMMWRKMPDNMLGKCAEAKALRKAFPQVMSGLYVAEEMHQAGVVVAGGKAEKTEEQKQVELFESAKKSLDKLSDPVKMEEYKEKFAKSEKYSPEQREALIKILDTKLDKIKSDES